tara:strand:+ start:9850 stop:10863 length:1014 start_codon:yes stop_codon:yes gene_type:complete
MPIRKKNDQEAFRVCENEQIIKQTTAIDYINSGRPVRKQMAGTANTPPVQPTVHRNISLGEKVIYFGNAGIIMGPQRTTNEISGEGRAGFPSDTIDIVVGFNDGGDPCNGQIVNVNSVTDAARVYVSRAVKVDTMFGIANDPPNTGETAASAVVLKADKTRVVGRQGIKLVTGRALGVDGGGEKTSKGGKYEQSATIDLIAGNNIGSYQVPFPEELKPIAESIKMFVPNLDEILEYQYLQPAVMGDNLKIALAELADLLDSLASAQMTVNTALLGAFSALSIGLPPLGAALSPVTSTLANHGISSEWSIQQNLQSWANVFLGTDATRYICSKNVNLT